MQDKIIILECPTCKKAIPLKMSDFMQHLKGQEYEYLKVSRICMECKANLEFVCKVTFFVKSIDNKNINLDYFYNKRR